MLAPPGFHNSNTSSDTTDTLRLEALLKSHVALGDRISTRDDKRELLPEQVLNFSQGQGRLTAVPPGPFKGALYHPPVRACKCSVVSANGRGRFEVGFQVEEVCEERGAFEASCGDRGTNVVVLKYEHRVYPEEVVITSWLPDTCRLRVMAQHPPYRRSTHHPVSRNTSALRHSTKGAGTRHNSVKPALAGKHGGGYRTQIAPSVHTVLTGCAEAWEPLWEGLVLDIRDPAKPGQLRVPLPPPHFETDTLMLQVAQESSPSPINLLVCCSVAVSQYFCLDADRVLRWSKYAGVWAAPPRDRVDRWRQRPRGSPGR